MVPLLLVYIFSRLIIIIAFNTTKNAEYKMLSTISITDIYI